MIQVISLCLCLLAAMVSTARSAQVERVVVVFKTHFDIGYTDTAAQVVRCLDEEPIPEFPVQVGITETDTVLG